MIRISTGIALLFLVMAIILLVVSWIIKDMFVRNLGFILLAASVFWLRKPIIWNIGKKMRHRQFEEQ